MSLGGYADGGDDVVELDGRGRFGWIFGLGVIFASAVWTEYISRTGPALRRFPADYPPDKPLVNYGLYHLKSGKMAILRAF